LALTFATADDDSSKKERLQDLAGFDPNQTIKN